MLAFWVDRSPLWARAFPRFLLWRGRIPSKAFGGLYFFRGKGYSKCFASFFLSEAQSDCCNRVFGLVFSFTCNRHLPSEIFTRVSRCAWLSNTFHPFYRFSKSLTFSVLICYRYFQHHDLAAFSCEFVHPFPDRLALYLFRPIFSFGYRYFSFIEWPFFAAASFPKLRYSPTHSLISVTLRWSVLRPIFFNSLSNIFGDTFENLSRSELISSIVIVAITQNAIDLKQEYPLKLSWICSWLKPSIFSASSIHVSASVGDRQIGKSAKDITRYFDGLQALVKLVSIEIGFKSKYAKSWNYPARWMTTASMDTFGRTSPVFRKRLRNLIRKGTFFVSDTNAEWSQTWL